MSEGYSKKFQCTYCTSKFDFKRNLLAHERNKHGVEFVKIERTFKCKECGSSFSNCKSLNLHRSEVHGSIPNQKIFLCKYCAVTFCHLKNLKVHEREKHGVCKPVKPFQCTKCEAQYSKKYTLVVHDRKKHNTDGQKLSGCSCSLCGFKTSKLELCQHYEQIHGISIVSKTENFSSFEAFRQWKEALERDTRSRFVQVRACQVNLHGSKNYYFACHRSGYNLPDGPGIRQLKSHGNRKINGFCPAKLTVTEASDGICSVTYTQTHIGHDSDLEHLYHASKDKQGINTKLAGNMTFDDILDEIRNSASDSCLQRVHLVSKKDLSNIKLALNLNDNGTHHWSEQHHLEERHPVYVQDQLVMQQAGMPLDVHDTNSTISEQLQDLNKAKKTLKNEILNLIDSISDIEELKVFKKSMSSVKSRLSVLRNNKREYPPACANE